MPSVRLQQFNLPTKLVARFGNKVPQVMRNSHELLGVGWFIYTYTGCGAHDARNPYEFEGTGVADNQCPYKNSKRFIDRHGRRPFRRLRRSLGMD